MASNIEKLSGFLTQKAASGVSDFASAAKAGVRAAAFSANPAMFSAIGDGLSAIKKMMARTEEQEERRERNQERREARQRGFQEETQRENAAIQQKQIDLLKNLNKTTEAILEELKKCCKAMADASDGFNLPLPIIPPPTGGRGAGRGAQARAGLAAAQAARAGVSGARAARSISAARAIPRLPAPRAIPRLPAPRTLPRIGAIGAADDVLRLGRIANIADDIPRAARNFLKGFNFDEIVRGIGTSVRTLGNTLSTRVSNIFGGIKSSLLLIPKFIGEIPIIKWFTGTGLGKAIVETFSFLGQSLRTGILNVFKFVTGPIGFAILSAIDGILFAFNEEAIADIFDKEVDQITLKDRVTTFIGGAIGGIFDGIQWLATKIVGFFIDDVDSDTLFIGQDPDFFKKQFTKIIDFSFDQFEAFFLTIKSWFVDDVDLEKEAGLKRERIMMYYTAPFKAIGERIELLFLRITDWAGAVYNSIVDSLVDALPDEIGLFGFTKDLREYKEKVRSGLSISDENLSRSANYQLTDFSKEIEDFERENNLGNFELPELEEIEVTAKKIETDLEDGYEETISVLGETRESVEVSGENITAAIYSTSEQEIETLNKWERERAGYEEQFLNLLEGDFKDLLYKAVGGREALGVDPRNIRLSSLFSDKFDDKITNAVTKVFGDSAAPYGRIFSKVAGSYADQFVTTVLGPALGATSTDLNRAIGNYLKGSGDWKEDLIYAITGMPTGMRSALGYEQGIETLSKQLAIFTGSEVTGLFGAGSTGLNNYIERYNEEQRRYLDQNAEILSADVVARSELDTLSLNAEQNIKEQHINQLREVYGQAVQGMAAAVGSANMSQSSGGSGGLFGALGKVWDNVTGGLGKVWGGIKNIFGIGESESGGFLSSIGNMWKGVTDTFGNVASSVKNFFGFGEELKEIKVTAQRIAEGTLSSSDTLEELAQATVPGGSGTKLEEIVVQGKRIPTGGTFGGLGNLLGNLGGSFLTQKLGLYGPGAGIAAQTVKNLFTGGSLTSPLANYAAGPTSLGGAALGWLNLAGLETQSLGGKLNTGLTLYKELFGNGLVNATSDLLWEAGGKLAFGQAAYGSLQQAFGESVMNFADGMSQGLSGFGSGGAAQTLGQIAGAAGSFMLGRSLTNALSGGYAVNKYIDEIAGVAAMIPGVGQIAAVVASVINRAFGRKPKQYTNLGMDLNLGTTTTGETFKDWVKKGGWFRSDKRGTERENIDPELAEYLGTSVTAIQTGLSEVAESIGLTTEKIEGFTKSISISWKPNASQQQIQQLIAGALQDYSDSMIRTAYKQYNFSNIMLEGETLTDAFVRMASSVSLVEDTMRMFGIETMNAVDVLANLNLTTAESVADLGAYDYSSLLNQLPGLTQTEEGLYEMQYTWYRSPGYYSRTYPDGTIETFGYNDPGYTGMPSRDEILGYESNFDFGYGGGGYYQTGTGTMTLTAEEAAAYLEANRQENIANLVNLFGGEQAFSQAVSSLWQEVVPEAEREAYIQEQTAIQAKKAAESLPTLMESFGEGVLSMFTGLEDIFEDNMISADEMDVLNEFLRQKFEELFLKAQTGTEEDQQKFLEFVNSANVFLQAAQNNIDASEQMSEAATNFNETTEELLESGESLLFTDVGNYSVGFGGDNRRDAPLVTDLDTTADDTTTVTTDGDTTTVTTDDNTVVTTEDNTTVTTDDTTVVTDDQLTTEDNTTDDSETQYPVMVDGIDLSGIDLSYLANLDLSNLDLSYLGIGALGYNPGDYSNYITPESINNPNPNAPGPITPIIDNSSVNTTNTNVNIITEQVRDYVPAVGYYHRAITSGYNIFNGM